jgi:recombination associated protein RdgC
MLKSFTVFRVRDDWESPRADALAETLSRFAFRPCGATERHCAGWVPPRGVEHAALVENVGGQYLMKLMVEARLLPASAVKAHLDERLDGIEASTGRRPRGKAKRELKEQVEHDLLPRAFTRKRSTLVWLDPKARTLVLGTTTPKSVEAILVELKAAFGDDLQPTPVQTSESPASAMSAWLIDREAPAGFTIDRDCELRQPDGTKATVRYVRHTLDTREVGEHIRKGKVPVTLAMTWADRVSFVLTDDMRVRRVKFLDVETSAEPAQTAGGDEDPFDADAALTTGQLARMLAALMKALGGESSKAPDARTRRGRT